MLTFDLTGGIVSLAKGVSILLLKFLGKIMILIKKNLAIWAKLSFVFGENYVNKGKCGLKFLKLT